MAVFTTNPPPAPRSTCQRWRPAASTATRTGSVPRDATTTCGLGSAAGRRRWRSLSFVERSSHFAAAATSPVVIELPCRRITRRQDGEPYIQSQRPFWLLDAHRHDAIRGSDAAFLGSLAIAWVLSGVVAYFYALWTIGPV